MSIRRRRRAPAGATCAIPTSSTSARSTSLRGIDGERNAFRFGALTTWTDLQPRRASAGLRRLPGGGARDRRRAGAEPRHAGRQHLHRLAGRRRHSLPADARRGDRACIARADGAIVPIGDFIDGYRHTLCRPDEIVTAILIPKPRRRRARQFLKLGARRYLVISIVMAAGVSRRDEDGTIDAARASRSAPARRSRSACRRWRRRSSGARLADAADIVERDASRGPDADRRHPRSGAFRQRRRARPRARPARRLRAEPRRGGPPDARPAAHRRATLSPSPSRVNGEPVTRRRRTRSRPRRDACATSSA